ncbi:Protein ERP1 [Cyberlindnera fabianii]|uniref:Protein ERP1 n=1 Tax=Cyberlindnera fabianii TaxID=36022 RepID=A0A1V2LFB9_CYBFA|nr:Protein ERP1 [Cyberlindnera fabianii]
MQLTVVSLLLCYLSVANAFYFYLAGGERKCFYKELSRGTLLVGNYDVEVFDQNTESFTKATQKQLGVIIDVEEVFDDNHRVVHQRGAPNGEFTFSAIDSGDHRICFQPQSQGWLAKIKTKIDVEFKIGDGEELDSKKKGKVQSLTERVKTLNQKILEIRREQKLTREREASFRDLSEATNSRVVNWSIIQLITLGGTCFWQLKHLRSFFVKQKIV